jgi:hypothetical protein
LFAVDIDPRILDAWMGHQTESIRRRHHHLFPDQQRQAFLAVFGSAQQASVALAFEFRVGDHPLLGSPTPARSLLVTDAPEPAPFPEGELGLAEQLRDLRRRLAVLDSPLQYEVVGASVLQLHAATQVGMIFDSVQDAAPKGNLLHIEFRLQPLKGVS